ncbi:MAG TPA: hypothetical protein VL326_09980 [Kofleriaceae bacterium]|nr:hypothetical protein [Kofleriaceae bacterium]
MARRLLYTRFMTNIDLDQLATVVGGAGKKLPVIPGEDAFDAFPAPDFGRAHVAKPKRSPQPRKPASNASPIVKYDGFGAFIGDY